MAHLKVRLRGKLVYDLNLNPGQTYVAGRNDSCDIVLEPTKGISREHFNIAFENNEWKIDVLSKYYEILHGGIGVRKLILSSRTLFFLPPYEFEYLEATDSRSSDANNNLPALAAEERGLSAIDEVDEKTVIGAAPLIAYLKVMGSDNEPKEIFRLEEGDCWAAGRESSCQIKIRDQRVSRRQFEIRRIASQYYIIDLGSVNGTVLNGNPISATDPVSLKSGDSISVLDNFFYFELHDKNFKSRVESVNVPILVPTASVHQDSLMPSVYGGGGYEVMGYAGVQASVPNAPPFSGKTKFDFEKNRPKIIVGVILFLAFAYFMSDSGSGSGPVANKPAPAGPGSWQEIYKKLKPEEQMLVRQRYRDAKNLYMQGKYQLAQDEIIKLQELIPDYEDTKEIDRLAKEAVYLKKLQEEEERRQKDKQDIEEKIQTKVAECQKKINPDMTMEQLEECISSVVQFNPEHPQFLSLKSQVDGFIAHKNARRAEKAELEDQARRLQNIFIAAQKIEKNGKSLDAIAAYERVLKTNLFDPNGLKGKARRSIVSLKESVNKKTSSLLSDAESLYQSQKLKEAISALRKARVLDPDNLTLNGKIDQYANELRKQMMIIYQEGILEESFGNIEGGESKAGAKDKWKKILELDIADGEYYKKAFIKLKKYGAL